MMQEEQNMQHMQSLQHPQSPAQVHLAHVQTPHSNLFNEGPVISPYHSEHQTAQPANCNVVPLVTAVTSHYAGEKQREVDYEQEEEDRMDQVGGQMPDFSSGRQNVKSPMLRATSVTASMQNVHAARNRSRNGGGAYSQSSAHLSRPH